MKAFFVGLLFLLVLGLLSGLAVLFFPFIFILSLTLRVLFMVALFVLAVWFLGRFIMLLWAKSREGK